MFSKNYIIQLNLKGLDKSVQIYKVPYNFFSFKNVSFIALNLDFDIIFVNLSAQEKYTLVMFRFSRIFY
jgi:hypothetical protein